MVALQVALTLLILSSRRCGKQGFLRLVKTDLGYDPHQTMSLPIPIHEGTYPSWKERSEYFEQIRSRIAAMPQVIAARHFNQRDAAFEWKRQPHRTHGRAAQAEQQTVRVNFINQDYFPVLRIPLIARASLG